MASTEEVHVGICEHANTASGFRGVLKEHPQDFGVTEIDPLGYEITLSDENPPEGERQRSQSELSQSREQQLSESNVSNAMAHMSQSSLLSTSDTHKVTTLVDCIAGRKLPESVLDDTEEAIVGHLLDKQSRSALHHFIRYYLGDVLDSEAVESPEPGSAASAIRILPKRSGRTKRKREPWPKSLPPHLHFSLHKTNRDTSTALEQLARRLGTTQKAFGFAGTKDKRAVTLQRASVHRQRASALARAASLCPGVRVGGFGYRDYSLGLGELSGNVFDIMLRHVRSSRKDVDDAVEAIKQSGAINYFGLQRFGQASIYRTHHVGRTLIRGDWSFAVSMLLQPPEIDDNSSAYAAKAHYASTGNANAAAKMLPTSMSAERSLLHSLNKSPNNLVQALQSIPKATRLLYVHSYQSYLFNLAASARVREHGIEQHAVAGDLITDTVRLQHHQQLQQRHHHHNDEEKEEEEEKDDREVQDDATSHDHDGDGDQGTSVRRSRSRKRNDIDPDQWPVRQVTEQEEADQSVSVSDVLIPVPGIKTELPGNAAARAINAALEDDGIALNKSPHNVREFSIQSLSGTYRPLLLKPQTLEYEYFNGNDEDAYLEDDQQRTAAVRLRFGLGTGAYATMYIRELTKGSTATVDHKRYTQEEKQRKDETMFERNNSSMNQNTATVNMHDNSGDANLESVDL